MIEYVSKEVQVRNTETTWHIRNLTNSYRRNQFRLLTSLNNHLHNQQAPGTTSTIGTPAVSLAHRRNEFHELAISFLPPFFAHLSHIASIRVPRRFNGRTGYIRSVAKVTAEWTPFLLQPSFCEIGPGYV